MTSPSENAPQPPQPNTGYGPPAQQPNAGYGAPAPQQAGQNQYAPPAPAGQPQQVTNVYYTTSQPKGFSVTALILGLASIIFGFTFFVPVGALIFGVIGMKKEPAGKGMALVGVIVGGLTLLVWLLIALLFGGIIASLFSIATFG